jgi:hypothetical protein
MQPSNSSEMHVLEIDFKRNRVRGRLVKVRSDTSEYLLNF